MDSEITTQIQQSHQKPGRIAARIIAKLRDNKPARLLAIDIGITILFCIFWVWFGYQYGFRNTPDSWYRGILAKSIVEGHPYFINLKQGYIYEFGPFHYDVTHPPFIPILMAAFFFVFGPKIIFANLISCVSAGLLVFPLIRISRELCKTSFIGYLIYFFPVFIEKSGFLFETFGGLSIPTTMFLLFCFVYFYLLTWKHERKLYPILSGLFLAFAALTRFDALGVSLLIIAWHVLLALFFWFKKNRQLVIKIMLFAGVYLLLISPWMIRNFLIFKDPLFTHMTPMIWTDNPLEYWDYHEQPPFPSAKVYFEKHTLLDFLHKILNGLGNVYRMIGNDILSFTLWPYLFISSLLFLLVISFRQLEKFLLYVVILALSLGYLVPFAITPYLDHRYMIPLIFLFAFSGFTAFYNLSSLMQARLFSSKKHLSLSVLVNDKKLLSFSVIPIFNTVAVLILCLVTYKTQEDFWRNSFKTYLPKSYDYEDKHLAVDPTVNKLKKELTKEDVILGPFAEVQRLNFATGLTFIEVPANLKSLDDPYEFFKKYHINYSMVDVTAILPKKYIQGIEIAGNAVLYKINLGASVDSDAPLQKTPLDISKDVIVRKSIQNGKKEKRIFIDVSHGDLDPDFKVLLRSWGYNPISPQSGFQSNKEKLFQSGILMMSYKIGGGELSEEEMEIIKRYIASGGSLFLLCPIWVWTGYDHKPVELNPYHQIGKLYNLLLVEEYPKGRLHTTPNAISQNLTIQSQDWWGNFSRIISLNTTSISLLEDQDKESFGMAAVFGKSKLVLIGQNFLAKSITYKKDEKLRTYTVKLLDWLIKD
jgi:hypothetical protein